MPRISPRIAIAIDADPPVRCGLDWMVVSPAERHPDVEHPPSYEECQGRRTSQANTTSKRRPLAMAGNKGQY